MHWPTNTCVPPFSPPVALPQPEIDALVGTYIAGNRLDTLTAGPGAITWTAGADAAEPTVYSTLVPRANGWFSTPDSQDLEITVTNITGETALLARMVSGPYQLTMLVGQRYEPQAIPEAWTARQSTIFLVDDLHPLDYIRLETVNYAMVFSQSRGILHHASGFSNGYLHPHNDHTAFVLGLGNRGPGAVLARLTNGVERLQCGGYNFIDAAGVPTLPAGTTVGASLPNVQSTVWYRIPVRSCLSYVARLQSGDGCAAVICDAEGNAIAWGAAGDMISWRATAAGFHYIGVYGNGHIAGAYELAVAVRSNGGHDFDGDGRADPGTIRDGTLQAWLSAAGYAPQTMNLDAATTDHVLAADCDGDGYADPVLVRPDGSWTAWLSGNGYAQTTLPLGTTAGTPLLADVDGDGRADPILILNGLWYVWPSTLNYQVQGPFDLGLGNGRPFAADLDGDGKADPGMVNGNVWTVALSGSTYALRTESFNVTGIPCPGDYDGDGYADPAVFNQGWHAWLSGSGYAYIGPVLPDAAGQPVP
ncbi:MAG: VCBS repeat-containing protein [Lentisphaerae bacterium]|nr:VCBS repeat-containing protein [Lentisphaerota bacterium]